MHPGVYQVISGRVIQRYTPWNYEHYDTYIVLEGDWRVGRKRGPHGWYTFVAYFVSILCIAHYLPHPQIYTSRPTFVFTGLNFFFFLFFFFQIDVQNYYMFRHVNYRLLL